MKHPLLCAFVLSFFSLFPACGTKTPTPDTPSWELTAQRAINEGNAAYQKGCYRLALQHYQGAFEGYTVADNGFGTALSLNNLGNTYRMLQKNEDALAFYTESGRRAALQESQDLKEKVLANRVSLLLDLEKYEEARDLMPEMGDTDMPRGFIRSKARLLSLEDRREEAINLLHQSLKSASSAEKPGLFFSLGEILLAQENPEAAREAFAQALDLDKNVGRLGVIAADLMALARCESALEKHNDAADFASRAMEIWALTGDTARLATHEAFFTTLTQKSVMDLTLSRHFIQLWQTRRAVSGPCD